jgi:hypothetical protein
LNVLKPNLRVSIQSLLQAGKAQREIARIVGVGPRTVRQIEREAKCPGAATGFSAEKADFMGQNVPPWPRVRHYQVAAGALPGLRKFEKVSKFAVQ